MIYHDWNVRAGETKVNRSDVVVVSSYAVTFMLLGVWMLAAALGMVGIVEAFVLWIASIGAVVVVLGLLRASESPRVALAPVAVGAFLVVLGLLAYFVLGDSLGIVAGFALLLIICSILVIVIYITGYSMENRGTKKV